MIEKLDNCVLCPHKCNVNRNKGELGRCKMNGKIKIALYSLHKFEEPCISGKNGSGTTFFTGCNLSCLYCQNYKISQEHIGTEITVERLAEIFIEQQEKGAENINLVTPTMYVYHIIEALDLARKKGLNIPIIYNSNGYENIETLKLLEGYIDVYLPDLKYSVDKIGKKYSKIDSYFEIATNAIREMYRQVGTPEFNSQGIIQKGIIIRHLILPNNILNSKLILNWIKNNIDKNVYISLMAQYFPTYLAKSESSIARKLNEREYNSIINYIEKIGLEKGYIQGLEENEEQYVPDFDNGKY